MIQTGFESRIKLQDIIENQLPEFILDESPKTSSFLKQYYISQEFQGGTVDIVENLDQYLKLDNLIPEVVIGSTTLTNNVSATGIAITVTSTKGFPQKYGLLKIDNEIITYTGITTNTFTGCIRGFSGITSYHKELNSEELVFSTSEASSHNSSSNVQNLSAIFLQEFYKKLKYTLTPGLENLNFVSDLNVGNFVKEARTLYESKGSDESFRILFNILFGETPKVVDLEQFLLKPSSASYVRRKVVVVEAISGNPLNLSGQTIIKTTDPKTTASVSEVETIFRGSKNYYKLLLFVGYDDSFPTITGSFDITGSTRNLDYVSVGSSVISVDSTIGFPESGKIYSGNNVITYRNKSVNQFFECSGINSGISTASVIYGENTYYGYEEGDLSKKVVFRITGTLSGYEQITKNTNIEVGEQIIVKNIGELIKNPSINKTKKEIFANSWIYNTSSRYQINRITSASQFEVKSDIDKSSLKVGDYIDILYRDSQSIVKSNLQVTNITNQRQVTVNSTISDLNQSFNYDIRRKLKHVTSSGTTLEFNRILADIQNVYNENDEYLYVASNSLPSYNLTKSLFTYNAVGVEDKNEISQLYSIIEFNEQVSFKTGSEIYYKPSGNPISGLTEGLYYVEVVSTTNPNKVNKQIRLYISRNIVGTSNYVEFGELTSGTHNFTLSSQKEKVLSPQKILRKFPLNPNIAEGNSEITTSGPVGMLINGVEILNYKSTDKIYYGPLQSVNVLSGGKGYDVINPPELEVSEGNALIQPILSGSVEKVYVVPQEFNINTVVSIALTGGNGTGASFEPVIERKRRELIFDAKQINEGGGVDVDVDTITFLSNHGLSNGEPIIYISSTVSPLGIGNFKGNNFDTGETLENETTYYAKYVNNKTIELYPTFTDYVSGINTIGFTTAGTAGLQKFVTRQKNVLTGIKVLNGGSGYSNRKLRVSATGISTENDVVTYTNHGFKDGELITYSYEQTQISGLSTSKQYYVIKIDDNNFKLADAGVGGTYFSNYERRKNVNLVTTGSGYQIFNYPEISLKVEYSSVGLGTTQSKSEIEATAYVRGQIIDTYVYEGGSDYGSLILNQHSKPKINVLSGKEAQITPIVVDGKIKSVSIQYGGVEYYSTPDLKVNGTGKGAILKPVIVNNRISSVIIINPGSGYSSSNTSITVEPAGKNVIFDPQVRSLTINNNFLYDTVDDTSSIASEIIKKSYNNLQYSVSSYSQSLQTIFGDSSSTNPTTHSPIIGWAYDGNPIYGSNGYTSPSSTQSFKRLLSGYTSNLTNVENRPSGFAEGFFVEDYKFTNSGDLDEYNGRFCITPEFPNGTYAYFATVLNDTNFNNRVIGKFPYFIGSRYRSKFIEENKNLNQSFNFNNSNLIRNTFPYKVGEKYAGNEFIIESNKLNNQFAIVESLTEGPVDNFKIISSGVDYKVGDSLEFNESESSGGGLLSQVSEVEGKDIVNLQTSITTYDDSIFTWENGESIKIKIEPRHELKNLDYVNISGFSTELSNLNGFYQIGVTTYSTTLLSNVSNYATSGIVTDIYVTNIPKNVSIGSSIVIESETFKVLNVFQYNNVIRVYRETTGSAHTATTPVYFIPDSFVINKSVDYFESKPNDLVYFNPKQSIGIGTSVGVGVGVTYTIGSQNKIVSIPTQTIYIPNHPFKTNQAVTLTKTPSSLAISVANTSGSSSFNLPSSGNSQTVYIIRKSVDHIGIVTQIGLTTTTNGLFFITNGTNTYDYLLQSNNKTKKSTVKKILTTVSTNSDHNLQNGDKINLFVKPNLSVGIGTSTSVRVKYDSSRNKLLINQRQFTSSGINTVTNAITIPSHQFKTGDKVLYTATTVASGLGTGYYYVFKINDNSFNLCETVKDSFSNPPLIVDILSSSSSNNQLSLINPEVNSIKNNNLIFDVSDSSLSGYNFKLFYDEEFKDEFVSTGKTSGFTITRSGSPGSANAKVTINCNDDIDFPLHYALEDSGEVVSADKEVQNYSKINFINSYYNGSYNISGVGSTTFSMSLTASPENLSYTSLNCDVLKYTTPSTTASGSISKIKIISPGYGFDRFLSLTNVNSVDGNGASISAISDDVGRIKEFRILNEGFEYASDKTLRPEASIPKTLVLENVNEIKSIKVLEGGRNYINPPDLIVVDSSTGEKIDSGVLIANIENGSIRSVLISGIPKGLPERTTNILAVNNTNGVGIRSAQSSSSGIVTCTLVTPLFGFTIEPFAIGDKIFVEGIAKDGTSGDGFNSQNYGYKFFTVSNYQNAGSVLPRIVEFNISGLTTNPGITSSIQDYRATIVNYKNYPKFEIAQDFSNFTNGETLEVKTVVGFVQQDLQVVSSNQNNIKVSGLYNLEENAIIRGSQSGSLATINSINESTGRFIIGYGSTQRIGWSDDIGKLDEDFQVIADNDYYQNLSYTIKSKQTWEDIVSPVNNIVHISGLKNFSDTEILNTVKSGIASAEYTLSRYDIIDEKRVDTINNFDLVLDDDVDQNVSKALKFKNRKLTDYIECRTNRVLEIDDISNQFFTPLLDNETSTKIVGITTFRKYEKYLIQISNKNLSEFQLVEVVVLLNNNDVFTLEKSAISNKEYSLGEVYAESDEFDNFYLTFFPRDPYNNTYNIKYLNTTFESNTGVGTTSIGFVNLTGVSSPVAAGSTLTLIERNVSSIESIYSEINIINDTTGEMNYVEFYSSHDETDTYMSEFYFDTTDEYSSNFIGTFTASLSGGVFKLQYQNTSPNAVTLRSRNVGFGSTAVGVGTYRFKLGYEPDGEERTVNYNSLYSNVSAASTVVSFDKTLFSSVKSLIKIGIGTTSALHQVMTIVDSNDIYTLQYPFFSIGNTSGIGTFGGEINGSTASLIFYPDPEFSGEFEILSFNQIFYTEFNSLNVPPSLVYDNIVETLGLSTYYAINDEDNGRLSFELKYENIPIFMKKFDPSDSSVLILEDNKFFIRNHFFNTGEELIYRPKSTFTSIPSSSIGIGTTLNNVGVNTDILPTTVYAIRIDNDTFKLATRKEYATATPANPVTILSTGSGNAHELEMVKKNEKSIISINNIIQSPIAYASLNYSIDNGGPVSSSSTIFGISGIGSIKYNDILKIDDEYLKVLNVGFGTTLSGPISSGGTLPLVQVKRAVLGSVGFAHSDSSSINIYRGSFNILKSNIYFTDAPKAIINESSIARYNLANTRAYFNGRVFLRKDYTTNKIYDDVSDKFTGIGQTYTLTVNGINTVGSGLTGGSGIVLINGIFQPPSTQNNLGFNYSITENSVSGVSSIVFSGNSSSYISSSDVNIGELPRGGMIISLGSTPGLGYAPLVGASVTAIIGAGGSITNIIPSMIGIGTTVGSWGSGYRSPVSVAVTQFGHSGTAASIRANVGAGGTLSFSIVNGGSGYTNPTINVSSPSYGNLEVIGVSRLGIGTTTLCGTGLLLNVDVGPASTTGIGSTLFEVTGFEIIRNGYGFKKGDVIKAIGLVTAYGLSQPISDFTLTVVDTFNDAFSSWQFGELDYIDSIKPYQDGIRTRFSLYYNSQLLSFEKNNSDPDSQLIDFNSLLLIFINGVLQQPGVSYQFDGGTSFIFSAPPREEDNVSIFFYRGSSSDSSLKDIFETIKLGDTVQVFSNNNILGITTTQEERLVTGISSSTNIKTNPYILQGIDEVNNKPLFWSKQKVDKIIDGDFVSKARDSIEPQIYPTSKVIKDLSTSDNVLFVDNAEFFNYENSLLIDFDAIVFSEKSDPVSAAVTAIVSVAGTIQSISILDPGSGYIGATTSLKIASPAVKPAIGIVSSLNSVGMVTQVSIRYGGYKYSSPPTVRFTNPPVLGAGIGTVATGTANISNGIVTSVTITNPGFGYVVPPSVIFSTPGINTATATATITNGQISSITVINPGFAYTNTNPPQVIVSSPKPIYENITGVDDIQGFSCNIVGIGTTVGIGTNLAIKFTLDPSSSPFTDLTAGYYVYIYDTFVGSGVTSIINTNTSVVGVGTTFLDNIYHVSAFNDAVGIITCNIHSSSSVIGIGTTGSIVGKLSWGRFSGFSRSSYPISIAVSGYTVNSGLTTFPTIQRRGFGLRNNGSIKKII